MTTRQEQINQLIGVQPRPAAPPERPPVTPDEVYGPDVLGQLMDNAGITDEYLVGALARELQATSVTTAKIKSAGLRVAPGWTIVAETGGVPLPDGTEIPAIDGESLIAFEAIDWKTRQKARIDAHKLKAHYPAAKSDVNVHGDGTLLGQVLNEIDGKDRGQLPLGGGV